MVACNGGGGPLGHPRVYLNLASEGKVECPYCSRLYRAARQGGRRPWGGDAAGQSRRASAAGLTRQALSAPTRHVYLVDGSGYIFRAYHALPPLTRADGTPIGAVLGFANMLLKLLQETDADHIAVVFDAAGTTFRNRIYDAVQGAPPRAARRSRCRNSSWCARRPTPSMSAASSATITRPTISSRPMRATRVAQGATVTIVSSDKDLMQLVGDGIADARPDQDSADRRRRGAGEIRRRAGARWSTCRRCAATASTTCPGVPGIGVKTAAELINAYGDLENLLAHAPEIKQPKRRQALIDFAEQARLSKRLVTLDDNVPLPCRWTSSR